MDNCLRQNKHKTKPNQNYKKKTQQKNQKKQKTKKTEENQQNPTPQKSSPQTHAKKWKHERKWVNKWIKKWTRWCKSVLIKWDRIEKTLLEKV